jgi:hypothetical protein
LIQVYLKNKAGALIGGILLLAFFLLKDGIWRYIQLFFLCVLVPLRKKENTLAKPAYRRPTYRRQVFLLCEIKKNTLAKTQRRKGFNWLDCFSPLWVKKVLTQSLSTAGRAQRRKGFTSLAFFAPFLLCEIKKKDSRKDAKPPRFCDFSLRLLFFARIKKGISATP